MVWERLVGGGGGGGGGYPFLPWSESPKAEPKLFYFSSIARYLNLYGQKFFFLSRPE